MNSNIEHTIVLVKHPRIRLTAVKPNRTLGPGVYHFSGDRRGAFRTMSQTKGVNRGALEVYFRRGTTAEFLEDAMAAAVLAKDDATIKLLRRLGAPEIVAGAPVPEPQISVLDAPISDIGTPDIDISTPDISAGDPEIVLEMSSELAEGLSDDIASDAALPDDEVAPISE
jgi:hypothetical protein